MKHILIVDDDMHISNMLFEVLTKQDYKVSRAYSGTEALLFLSNEKPDLILLDLMLPGLSGEEVLEKIKDIPTIIVSAKEDMDNKVNLLLGGAADYVTKPFDMNELLARINIQLRNSNSILKNDLIVFDDIIINKTNYSVMVNSISVKLTKTEFAILKLLMKNPEQVMTKSVILDKISIDTPDCVESSLKVHISNLRKKLKTAGGKNYIEAVWGIGFKMKF
ncbi:MAG: response regulator transcription factor [Eubacterium sp.]|nr:response regulator transcription factor [Eubacterium sp.]